MASVTEMVVVIERVKAMVETMMEMLMLVIMMVVAVVMVSELRGCESGGISICSMEIDWVRSRLLWMEGGRWKVGDLGVCVLSYLYISNVRYQPYNSTLVGVIKNVECRREKIGETGNLFLVNSISGTIVIPLGSVIYWSLLFPIWWWYYTISLWLNKWPVQSRHICNKPRILIISLLSFFVIFQQ